MQAPYQLYGSPASPYSLKMRALLRYRRLAFIWCHEQTQVQQALKQVNVPVVPVLIDAEGRAYNDSTPMAFALEEAHTERSVVPEDPALAFLACLIEDFADEWGTKIMFWYRWAYPQDQALLGLWLAADMQPASGKEQLDKTAEFYRTRQISRMAVVGCTPHNAPVLEASYHALLNCLESLLQTQRYLLGTRPSLADFALYGQLSQLSSDPTPQAILRNAAPYTARWLVHLEDASGIEGSWAEHAAIMACAPFNALLSLIGTLYLPFLNANAQALQTNAKAVELTLLGHSYTQAPFKYQAKCLQALRERWQTLSFADQNWLRPMLGAAEVDGLVLEG
jgi:glutathione S-transferase